jgi:hypothetical protein
MKKFWKIMLYSTLTLFVIILIAYGVAWENKMDEFYAQRKAKADKEALFEQQKPTILWSGYNNDSFDVKITSYDKKGNTYFVGEEIISNLSWAKLVLKPTIGSMPTLLYMDDNSGQIKIIVCSAAEIL